MRASGPLTSFYLLAALDLQRDAANAIVRVPEERAIYLDVLVRTFRISLTVTLLCLLMAFPVAYLMSTQPTKIANVLMILVLLPFWTSLLVRTAAWVVLLQNEGLVNHLLLWLRIIDAPVKLIYNRIGVYVAMTHVLLPFMILPLYSSMKAINPPLHARRHLASGRRPRRAFVQIYLPQTPAGDRARVACSCSSSRSATTSRPRWSAAHGPDDQLLHRLLHHRHRELGHGLRAWRGAAGDHAGALRGLRPPRRRPRDQDRVARDGHAASAPYRVADRRQLGNWIGATLVLFFLLVPIIAIMPLSFSSGNFLIYPLPGFSLRWYQGVADLGEMATGAAQQPDRRHLRDRGRDDSRHAGGRRAEPGALSAGGLVMGLLLSPMIVPVVITAIGVYFFFAPLGLTNSYAGLILAHTALASPFVVITVSATLATFDTDHVARRRLPGCRPVDQLPHVSPCR